MSHFSIYTTIFCLTFGLITPPQMFAGNYKESQNTKRSEQKKEKLKFGANLWVKNTNGDINISGWDREEVFLQAEIRDSEPSRIEIKYQRKEDGLEIEATYNKPVKIGLFRAINAPRCNMTLNVPKRVIGYFRTVNGEVSATTIDGYARCESINGGIEVKNVSGEVHVETTNGSIVVSNLHARIKGETTNGRISLEDVDGGIQMETTNGSIAAKRLDGWGEGISLKTTNGGITVELGKASGEILAENTIGSIENHIQKAEIIEKKKHLLHLKVPGRSQNINLETTNGGIKIY